MNIGAGTAPGIFFYGGRKWSRLGKGSGVKAHALVGGLGDELKLFKFHCARA